jgi:hypothetical protein
VRGQAQKKGKGKKKTKRLTKQNKDPSVLAFDNALPPLVLGAAQTMFGEDSVFWTEHGYPTDGFFSYYSELESKPDEVGLIAQLAAALRPLAEAAAPGVR